MKQRISSIRRVKSSLSKGIKTKRSPVTKRVGKSRIHIRQANAFELQVFRLVNEERTSRGIAALTLNTQLTDLAVLKSRDMRDNNYFSHTSPTYGTPSQMLDRFGVAWRAYAENIAAGQATPEAVMRTWMNSTGHRANILDPRFTDIGVGYVGGTATSQYQHYWTQLFIQKP
ncbi:CAP domain-containing protein [Paenibacillus sp. FSL H7-0714]|uniref:CAP domain-containing protein n=1 Tax=Paenibacillus sp. FSL H7-0714 TaxID=2954735 RepID=UPI0030F8A582